MAAEHEHAQTVLLYAAFIFLVWFQREIRRGYGLRDSVVTRETGGYEQCRRGRVHATGQPTWSDDDVDIDGRLCALAVTVPGYRSTGSGFDTRRYHLFCEVLGLERGAFSLRIIMEVPEWKLQKAEIKGRGDSLRWPRDTALPEKLGTNFAGRSGRSVGAVHLRTTECLSPRSESISEPIQFTGSPRHLRQVINGSDHRLRHAVGTYFGAPWFLNSKCLRWWSKML
jgi:hypothetical protein